QQPYPHPPQYAPQYPQPPYAQQQFAPPPVNASPVQFSHLNPADVAQQKENIEIIMDVPLEVTVELGRTSRRIKEILEFAPGSIIELDKLAGEPIDILVNGKFVAKGEVVVIDENFGIRVTNIINAEFRI
ncbi:MAG: flagellar motor switch protein FliN, partial [Defluviitaleaceae bacterium]|nr:flagellar motor switch protein FliN [Defluviitaleaceae bacterium]